jgi:hypothetical protein
MGRGLKYSRINLKDLGKAQMAAARSSKDEKWERKQ